MDALFLILIIAVPILSVLGWLFWMVVIGFAAKKTYDAVSSSNMAGAFGGGMGYRDMDALFAQLDQGLRASAGSAAQGGSKAAAQSMSPEQRLQIQMMFMRAQNQMRQVDALSRQRYDTRMADLSGMAASAGLDWTPPSY